MSRGLHAAVSSWGCPSKNDEMQHLTRHKTFDPCDRFLVVWSLLAMLNKVDMHMVVTGQLGAGEWD